MTQTLILMILHIRNMNDEAGKSGHELLCFLLQAVGNTEPIQLQSNLHSLVLCVEHRTQTLWFGKLLKLWQKEPRKIILEVSRSNLNTYERKYG